MTLTLDDQLNSMNYSSQDKGLPFLELLKYVELNKDNGYFHSNDKSFWTFYQVNGIDDSLYSENNKFVVAEKIHNIFLDLLPGCGFAYYRYTNSDIRTQIGKFEQSSKVDLYGEKITSSISNHQSKASSDHHGFEYNVSRNNLEKAIDQENKLLHQTLGISGTSINREISRGFKPSHTTHLIGIRWTPKLLGSDKRLKNLVEDFKCMIGLNSHSEMEKQKYIQFAKLFLSMKKKITQGLLNAGLDYKEYTGQDMVNFMYMLLNPIRSKITPPPAFEKNKTISQIIKDQQSSNDLDKNSIKESILKSSFDVVPSGLDIHTPNRETYFYRTITTSQYKEVKTPDFINSKFMKGLEGDGLIAMHSEFETSDFLRVLLNLKLSQQEMALNIANAPLLSIFSNTETAKSKITDLRYIKSVTDSDKQTNRQLKSNVIFAYTAGGTDLDDINARLEKAQTQFDNQGVIETENGSAVVHHLLPGNFRQVASKKLNRSVPMLSGDYAQMLPIFVSFMGSKSDAILVNNRDGDPIFIDLFNENDTRTGHSLVVGATGTGKSFTFNYILMNLARRYEIKAWILDKGGSFRRSIAALGGEYQELNTGKIQNLPITCINPFSMTTVDQDLSTRAGHIKDTIDVISSVLSGACLTLGESNLIFSAAKKYLITLDDKEGKFSEYFEYLRKEKDKSADGDELADRFGSIYGEGQWARLFDGYSTLNWRADVIGFDIAACEDSILPVLMHMLFANISDYCIFKLPRNVRRLIVIDEAWKALSAKGIVPKVSGYYRELRKFFGACILISQTVIEFIKLIENDSSEDGDGILANTSHYFFMAVSPADYEAANVHLGFKSYEINAWRDIRSAVPYYAEVFYRRRLTNDQYSSGIFRIYCPPLLYWLSTSTAREVAKSTEIELQILEETDVSPREALILASEQLSKQHPYGLRGAA